MQNKKQNGFQRRIQNSAKHLIWIVLWSTLSWQRPLSYRNQPIGLQSKSVDWFLYDNGLRHERVNDFWPPTIFTKSFYLSCLTGFWIHPLFILCRRYHFRGLNPLSANLTLMVKHTQIADELFECLWPFCGVGT